MTQWKNKRILLGLVSLFLCGALVFSGCGGGEEETPDPAGNDPAVEQPITSEDEEEIDQDAQANEDDGIFELSEGEKKALQNELVTALGVNGVTIIEEENKLVAVSVFVERNEVEGEAGTVTYKIYDLSLGKPDSTSEPMQVIEVDNYYFMDEAPCYVGDYNFDGADDFSLWLWGGAQDSQGRFFLWDAAAGQFVENMDLGLLTSPMVKEEYEMIMEHVHVSAAEFIDYLYRWEDGELVPVRQIVQTMIDANSLQGEVHDWNGSDWELIQERKIILSEGDWTEEDYEKIDDLGEELQRYYDPSFTGL